MSVYLPNGELALLGIIFLSRPPGSLLHEYLMNRSACLIESSFLPAEQTALPLPLPFLFGGLHIWRPQFVWIVWPPPLFVLKIDTVCPQIWHISWSPYPFYSDVRYRGTLFPLSPFPISSMKQEEWVVVPSFFLLMQCCAVLSTFRIIISHPRTVTRSRTGWLFRIELQKWNYSVSCLGNVFLISLRHLPNSTQNTVTVLGRPKSVTVSWMSL